MCRDLTNIYFLGKIKVICTEYFFKFQESIKSRPIGMKPPLRTCLIGWNKVLGWIAVPVMAMIPTT